MVNAEDLLEYVKNTLGKKELARHAQRIQGVSSAEYDRFFKMMQNKNLKIYLKMLKKSLKMLK